jgi:LmbE family N-acetylglucosaminyl deacetylase
MRRVVALLPHPDDEIFFAALLARCVRDGADVHLVCATRGERGRAPADCTPDELAATRTRELEASCAIIGAPAPSWLDLPDGGLDAIGVPRLAAACAAAVASRAPDTLVTFGADGAYGHRDHLALAAAARDAARRLPSRPRVLAAAFPRGLFAPLYRRMRRMRSSPVDRQLGAAALGVGRDEVELVTPGSAPLKREMAAAHRSQLPTGNPDDFLAPGLLAALSEEEWYTFA